MQSKSNNKLQDWEVQPQYEPVELLGSGAYGQVCSAMDTETGEMVAIKRIDNVFRHPQDTVRIIRELQILLQLKSRNCVSLRSIIIPEEIEKFSTVYVVMELVESDLASLMQSELYLTLPHI